MNIGQGKCFKYINLFLCHRPQYSDKYVEHLSIGEFVLSQDAVRDRIDAPGFQRALDKSPKALKSRDLASLWQHRFRSTCLNTDAAYTLEHILCVGASVSIRMNFVCSFVYK